MSLVLLLQCLVPYIHYRGAMDLCGRNKILGYGFCICSKIFVVSAWSTHRQIHLSVSSSAERGDESEKILARCNNFTRHGQNQSWSTFWITLVWDFVTCFK